MDPIPFAILPAGIVFAALLVLFALGEVTIRVVSFRNSAGSAARPERVSYAVLMLAFAVAIAGSLVVAGTVPGAAIRGGREALFVVGVVLTAAGMALRAWAIVVLGRSFTVEVRVREAQQVVDRAPYSVVRHPSYTGLLLVFLGMGLALGNWPALAIAIVPAAAAIVFRIRIEEAALEAGIGEPYRAYRRRVRFRVVPFVW
jgi:protein-S-isoprenylcysteine O-methyltransferase Ste14